MGRFAKAAAVLIVYLQYWSTYMAEAQRGARGGVVPSANASLGLLLPAYWSGTGPTMLTTEWQRIAQYAQLLPITVITSSCCWPAAPERHALAKLRDAGVQLVYYVPTLDPNAYKTGKIACCDGYTNITKHVDEVLNETENPSSHVGLGPTDGIFFDNGPFPGAKADALYHRIYEYVQRARNGAPVVFNAQSPAAVTQDAMAMEHATFIAFESFPRYWHSQWFDNHSHLFDWSHYPRRRFGMLTENATTEAQMRESVDAAVALNIGRYYVTDQVGKYDRLPTYWDAFVRYVARKNTDEVRSSVVTAHNVRLEPALGARVQLVSCNSVATVGLLSLKRRLDGRVQVSSSGQQPLCLGPAEDAIWCTSNHDCQLNGVCDKASGRCRCDAAWKGTSCQELALDDDGSYAYGGPDSGITSWGGGPPAFDSATGNWTLFVTEIAGHCGLSEWGSQSTVVAATARWPAGPFHRQHVVISYQAHNPYYVFDKSAHLHAIFHIGNGIGVTQPKNCTNGTTPDGTQMPVLPVGTVTGATFSSVQHVGTRAMLAHTTAQDPSLCPCACGPCGSWVHTAPSLGGPWRRQSLSFNAANKTTGGSGFVLDNPAPYVFDNGTVLVLTRKINWCVMHPPCDKPRALTEVWLARAPQLIGPYEIIGDDPVTNVTNEEDPGIWRDHRGNFHAMFHGPGHAWSADGLKWSFKADTAGSAIGGSSGGCYNATLRKADGSVEVLQDAERPKVWVNQSTGLPTLLFYASGGAKQPTAKDGRARGFTVVQRIRTEIPPRSVSPSSPLHYKLVDCSKAESFGKQAVEEHGCAIVAQ